MATFLSAAQEKGSSVSRMARPGHFHGKARPSEGASPQDGVNGLPEVQQGQRSWPEPHCSPGDGLWLGKAGAVSSALAFAFCIVLFPLLLP